MRLKLILLMLLIHSLSLTAQPIIPNIGKMPGEKISSMKPSGTPGPSTRIFMRCGSSIQSGNEPLFVVDNVIYESNQIKFLDANNIERIDILKNAAASELYGYRASNGVVIITTKKSSQKKFTIKDAKDSVGVGFATITATSLNTGDSISFVANGFGRIETTLLKSLNYKLTVTCAGYTPKQILLREVMKNKYEILLEKDLIELKELTVVGYSTSCVCSILRCVCPGVRIKTFQADKNVIEINKSVKIFPNPVSSSGTINISFPNVKEGLYQIRLTGSSGQLIYSCEKQINSKNQTEQIYLTAHTAAGIYLLQILDERKKLIQSSKVFVQ